MMLKKREQQNTCATFIRTKRKADLSEHLQEHQTRTQPRPIKKNWMTFHSCLCGFTKHIILLLTSISLRHCNEKNENQFIMMRIMQWKNFDVKSDISTFYWITRSLSTTWLLYLLFICYTSIVVSRSFTSMISFSFFPLDQMHQTNYRMSLSF